MSRDRLQLLLIVAAIVFAVAACARSTGATSGPMQVEITHLAGKQPLTLDEKPFGTAAGDDLVITQLRYYLSNFRLRRADGGWYALPRADNSSAGYYLVDAANPASTRFDLAPVPAGRYLGVEFLIGVDEARNGAGAQTGTLDPALGMYWTWNAGYIFLKLEGISLQSSLDQHALSYHLGGSGAGSAARTVYLPFVGEALIAGEQHPARIALNFDIARIFEGIHIANLPEAMSADRWAPLADNVAGAFSIGARRDPAP